MAEEDIATCIYPWSCKLWENISSGPTEKDLRMLQEPSIRDFRLAWYRKDRSGLVKRLSMEAFSHALVRVIASIRGRYCTLFRA